MTSAKIKVQKTKTILAGLTMPLFSTTLEDPDWMQHLKPENFRLIGLNFLFTFRTYHTYPQAMRRQSPTGGTAHQTTHWSCTFSYPRCRWGVMTGSSELNCFGSTKAQRSNLAEHLILNRNSESGVVLMQTSHQTKKTYKLTD